MTPQICVTDHQIVKVFLMIQSINVTQNITQFSYEIVCACQCPVRVQKFQLHLISDYG